MTELHAIAQVCNLIAANNGFERPSWGNIIIKLALVGTELDEARDAALGVGEDSLPEELADAAIRLLCILDAIWSLSWSNRVVLRRAGPTQHVFASIEALLWPTLSYVFKAVEACRYVDRKDDVRISLELALLEVFRLSDVLRIDLIAAIAEKCEKNRNRPKLHGKHLAAG